MNNSSILVFRLGQTMFKDLGQVTGSKLLIIIDERRLVLTVINGYIVTFSPDGLEK